VYLAVWFIQDRLLFGHYIYALPHNRRAVVEAGVPVKRPLSLLFIGSSLGSGIACILLAADLSSGQPLILRGIAHKGKYLLSPVPIPTVSGRHKRSRSSSVSVRWGRCWSVVRPRLLMNVSAEPAGVALPRRTAFGGPAG
jgi:hypothetical protein